MIRSIFLSAKRMGVDIRSCWRAFFNLVKKSKLRVSFGNSWRWLVQGTKDLSKGAKNTLRSCLAVGSTRDQLEYCQSLVFSYKNAFKLN